MFSVIRIAIIKQVQDTIFDLVVVKNLKVIVHKFM